MAAWQLRAARWTHALLYLLMIAVPLSGWIYSSSTGIQVVYLGLVPLPSSGSGVAVPPVVAGGDGDLLGPPAVGDRDPGIGRGSDPGSDPGDDLEGDV